MSRRRLRTGRHLEHEDSPESESEEEGEEFEPPEEEEEDQLREEQEEGELSPQPEDGHGGDGDEYGQEIEVPKDGDLEGLEIQDVELDLSEIKKRKRVQSGADAGHEAKKRRSNTSYPAKGKEKDTAHQSDEGSDGDHEMANTYIPFLFNHFVS